MEQEKPLLCKHIIVNYNILTKYMCVLGHFLLGCMNQQLVLDIFMERTFAKKWMTYESVWVFVLNIMYYLMSKYLSLK